MSRLINVCFQKEGEESQGEEENAEGEEEEEKEEKQPQTFAQAAEAHLHQGERSWDGSPSHW